MARSIPVVAALLALLIVHPLVQGADEPGEPPARYRVQSAFIHLGETVAFPVIEVEEGKTARVSRESGPGGPQYTVAVRVTPATADAVHVSLSYNSGKLSIQPNRLVTLGEPLRLTEDKVAVELRVDRAGG